MTKDPLDAHARRMDAKARGPEPDNPFLSLRVNADLSRTELAQLSHIDIMAISRSEVGCYSLPLPSLVDYWVRRGSITHPELVTAYEEFQLAQRKRNKFFFGHSLLVDTNDTLHPFRQLRNRRPSRATGNPLPVGITDCAKALCIPLDTLQFFEKKLTQQSVPKIIKLALNQNGYSPNQIAGFEASFKEWRAAKVPKVVTFELGGKACG